METLSNKNILEVEIDKSTKRISEKEIEIKNSIEELIEKIKTFTNWAWGFVWFGVFVGVLSVIYFFCKNNESGFALNLLGDFMSGAVGSIWSLAGLFFIYVAFLGQKQQLLNQQLEIMYSQLEVKYTRFELAGQKIEMAEQNKTLKLQKFENTFFQMLNLFHSIVNSLDIRKNNNTKDVIHSGRDCFKFFVKELRSSTLTHLDKINNSERTGPPVRLKEAHDLFLKNYIEIYDVVYQKHKSSLSHYFRTLYHIVKFIDESDIKDKKRYISIVRAQLSSYEQVMLFYNCIHSNGNKRFKPLIEKYTLFDNIDSNELLDINHYNNPIYFSKKAFE